MFWMLDGATATVPHPKRRGSCWTGPALGEMAAAGSSGGGNPPCSL